MYTNIAYSEAQKAHIAEQEARQSLVIFLGKLSGLLNSRQFSSWYYCNETRFTWAGNRLNERLRYDLMYQVDQALPRDTRGLTDIERLKAIADLCSAMVEKLEMKLDDKFKVAKKDQRFVFARDAKPSELILGLLSRGYVSPQPSDFREGFYLFGALHSLGVYARARETLEKSTGHAAFEKLLSGLTEEYLVSGYPHDLLAHDAHDIRSGVAVQAIAMRHEYCSTYLIREGMGEGEFSTHRFVPMAGAAVRGTAVRAA